MLGYILKRLLQVVPVFFGATLLIYFLVFAMPGDPILALFGDRTPNPAIVQALREQYHLNDPFIVQYWYYISGVFQGNLGVTYSGRPVAEVLAETLPVTGRLAVMAIAIEFTLAIIIGTTAALRKGKLFDNTSLVVALVALSIPIFVLCFIAQYFFALQLGWFSPTVGADNGWGGLWLPAIVLGFSLFAVSMRLMRSSTIDTLNQEWVRTAYGKGLPRRRVIPVHVLRNSLIPVITNSATNFGVLLVGATVTEGIFNVPGVGNTLYQAAVRGEGPTVVSFVTVFVILYVLVNLVIDLLYGLLDPRIRYA